jgi:neutral ceramidase
MWLLLAVLACKNDPAGPAEPELPRKVVAGQPVVGAAEGQLRLPVGTPLGGFSTRCTCLLGISGQDDRQSAYNVGFVESTGVQTLPTIKVIWIENGNDHLVLTKTDTIYSYDGLVEALEVSLSQATGLDLDGKVIHTTNHSHSSYGTFSDQTTFYLGDDKLNRENFERFVEQISDVAVDAYETREDAAIGLSWTRDWDPEDRVYRDRRGANDDLEFFPETPMTGKDPYLGLMRFDTLEGDPIAVMLNFGMHGTLLDTDNPMVSYDSGGGLETVLEESFDDQVVVMFTQGSGGDASPAGSDDHYARIESIGEEAVGPILDIWASTPTGSGDIRMETTERHIPQAPDQIQVTRNGTVDWHYPPYDPLAIPDGIVYEPDGSLSDFDEFNTLYGYVFCGTGDLDFPVGRLNTEAWPYSNCLDVELISKLLLVFFSIPEEELILPLPESLKAGTSASRMGPITTLTPEGELVDRELLVGFFPGESTAMFTEHWRQRVQAELGYEHAMLMSYSQDHEGYLLIPEDWLLGEYEPDIGLWGPLQSEHIMEGVMQMVDEVLSTDVHEDADPDGIYEPTDYPVREMPTLAPDHTPDAGTRLYEPPEYYWVPRLMTVDLTVPETVRRVSGMVQIGWIGGDPGADLPNVRLERLEGEEWVAVTSKTGRPINESDHDILLSYTPDPLYPLEAQQTHYWWSAWQAVGHVHDRAALPLGTYRLHVVGEHYVGDDPHYPWTTENYEVATESFELIEAEVTVSVEDGALYASLEGPTEGYRLIAMQGKAWGHNPLSGDITVEIESPDGTTVETVSAGVPVTLTVDYEHVGGRSLLDVAVPDNWTSITVTDAAGNTGTQ